MSTERLFSSADVALAAEGRDQANMLLHALMNDRRVVEERRAATGRVDPLKTLTGRSSMDRAIVSTRELLSRLDDLLSELRAPRPAANGTPATPRPVNGTLLVAGSLSSTHSAAAGS